MVARVVCSASWFRSPDTGSTAIAPHRFVGWSMANPAWGGVSAVAGIVGWKKIVDKMSQESMWSAFAAS